MSNKRKTKQPSGLDFHELSLAYRYMKEWRKALGCEFDGENEGVGEVDLVKVDGFIELRQFYPPCLFLFLQLSAQNY